MFRKARGAFFTPAPISKFISEWAVRSSDDTVLEPSCGEASFLLAAAHRLKGISASPAEVDKQLFGVEVHEPSASNAITLLRDAGVQAAVEVADFFDLDPTRKYDVIIGNPPYVRYQQFSGRARARALEAALAQGVRLNGLASSWAAFTIHACQFLRPSGRLGLVLPAELLSVSYAAGVRRFLLERFKSVRLVLFEERVFPGVLEEVVLLLAEGTGPTSSFEVFQVPNAAGLRGLGGAAWKAFTPSNEGKWTPALLPSEVVDTYREILASSDFGRLADWGEIYLGAVTGNNDFFAMSIEEAITIGLSAGDLRRVSPPGSRHLRGLVFSHATWQQLVDEAAKCYLFYPEGRPSAAARKHIAYGEERRIHEAFKCRTRDPWWRVPLVRVPDLFLTYMDQERPRLVTNGAQAYHLNSLYGVALHKGRKSLGRELLPLAALNTLSLLGAEIVGRSYGGGLLKLEPREADFLPIPSYETLRETSSSLKALRPQLAVHLRQGRLHEAVKIVDHAIFTEHMNVPLSTQKALRDARAMLFARRSRRGKGAVHVAD